MANTRWAQEQTVAVVVVPHLEEPSLIVSHPYNGVLPATDCTVIVPRFVIEAIQQFLEDKYADGLVFTAPCGGPVRLNNFRRRVSAPAAERIGKPDLVPHDLRDTAASLAISSGASVKAVQRMLGHASAKMTLDVGSLFEEDLEALADRIEERHDNP